MRYCSPMRVDIEGNLAALRRSRKVFCEWRDEAGLPMERVVAILNLEAMLAKGWKYLPLGKCDRWDPVAGKCLGHEEGR